MQSIVQLSSQARSATWVSMPHPGPVKFASNGFIFVKLQHSKQLRNVSYHKSNKATRTTTTNMQRFVKFNSAYSISRLHSFGTNDTKVEQRRYAAFLTSFDQLFAHVSFQISTCDLRHSFWFCRYIYNTHRLQKDSRRHGFVSKYCKSRIFRMHVILVYFVRGGFHTKLKCMRKVQSKSENPQRSVTVRTFHAYERSESPGYKNWVRTKNSVLPIASGLQKKKKKKKKKTQTQQWTSPKLLEASE